MSKVFDAAKNFVKAVYVDENKKKRKLQQSEGLVPLSKEELLSVILVTKDEAENATLISEYSFVSQHNFSSFIENRNSFKKKNSLDSVTSRSTVLQGWTDIYSKLELDSVNGIIGYMFSKAPLSASTNLVIPDASHLINNAFSMRYCYGEDVILEVKFMMTKGAFFFINALDLMPNIKEKACLVVNETEDDTRSTIYLRALGEVNYSIYITPITLDNYGLLKVID